MDDVERRVQNLEADVKYIKNDLTSISERLIRMEETLKTSVSRVACFDDYTKAIIEMSGSVKVLTDKINDIIVKMDKQDTRIDNIESKPGKIAIKGWIFVVTTLASILLGLLIGVLSK